MLNLLHPQHGIILTENDNNNNNNNVIDYNYNYNYTEENQPIISNNLNLNNILFFPQNNNNNMNNNAYGKDIDIDMITKMNQLTMVINLIEQRLIKNKKEDKNKTLSLLHYFNRWKILSNIKKKN